MRGQAVNSNQANGRLEDLQKRYREAEQNKKNDGGESQNTIRMQRQQIEKLKKDNDRLKEDLALETRQAKQANNMSASANIAKLQDQADAYNRKTNIEAMKIEELKRQLADLNRDLLAQRKSMGGINAAQEAGHHVQRQIKIRESRLDKALVKYNEASAHNIKLNSTIGNLRRERVVFDGIHKKLESELSQKKQQMAEIIETCNAAYEARDKAHAEMVSLKADADHQREKFEMQWNQLDELIKQDRRAKDQSMRQDHEESMANNVDPVYEEEARLRTQVSKGYENIAQSKADIHLSMEKVQSYEEAFAKIQKATSIIDIDDLVQTFTTAEDQNFQLFNWVNDLSNQIEGLEDKNGSLREEIKRYQVGGAEGDVRAKKRIVESLSTTLGKTETKSAAYEANLATTTTTTEALKKGITELFENVGMKDAAMLEQMKNTGVTESNLMDFMSVIEDRVSGLIQVWQSEQSTDDKAWDPEAGYDEGEGGDGGDYDGGVETVAEGEEKAPEAAEAAAEAEYTAEPAAEAVAVAGEAAAESAPAAVEEEAAAAPEAAEAEAEEAK